MAGFEFRIRGTSSTRLFGLMAAALMLAGCANSDPLVAPTISEPASSVVTAGTGQGSGGTIEGRVVDEEVLPLSHAEVSLVGTKAIAFTGEEGEFRFLDVAPGTYKIAAQRLGYSSATRSVEVTQGETATALLTLKGISIEEGWSQVFGPLHGFANCLVGTGLVSGPCAGLDAVQDALPEEKSTFVFRMFPNTTSIVAEMRWKQSTAATSQGNGLSFSHVDRDIYHYWCWGAGASPIRWQYNVLDNECIATGADPSQQEAAEPPKADQKLTLAIAIPFRPLAPSAADPYPAHVTFQQRFEVTYTLFQHLLPEPGYSAFEDS